MRKTGGKKDKRKGNVGSSNEVMEKLDVKGLKKEE
jgi:hypothetical protein